jgi:diguanylate cyclase (GGDEF)-like protein
VGHAARRRGARVNAEEIAQVRVRLARQRRATIPVLAVVVLMMLTLAFLMWQGEQEESGTKRALSLALEMSSAAREVKYNGAVFSQRQQAYALDIVRGRARALDPASAPRRVFLQSANVFAESLNALRLFPLSSEEKVLASRTRDVFEDYMRADSDIYAVFQRNTPEDFSRASALIARREAALASEISAVLDGLAESIEARARVLTRDAEEASARNLRWLAALTLGAMVLLVLFGVLLRRAQLLSASLISTLDEQARQDGLTGVLNRRALDEQLATEIDRARRAKTPLAVALFDLDHFKKFNDSRGHLEGDELLRRAARAWKALTRSVDALGRYGGEEFLLMLPGCDSEQARKLVERYRPVVPFGQTFSCGVAQWNTTENATGLLERADRALYAAKSGGRNRTEVAVDES